MMRPWLPLRRIGEQFLGVCGDDEVAEALRFREGDFAAERLRDLVVVAQVKKLLAAPSEG